MTLSRKASAVETSEIRLSASLMEASVGAKNVIARVGSFITGSSPDSCRSMHVALEVGSGVGTRAQPEPVL